MFKVYYGEGLRPAADLTKEGDGVLREEWREAAQHDVEHHADRPVQGYLAHKKQRPPRTLQQAYT